MYELAGSLQPVESNLSLKTSQIFPFIKNTIRTYYISVLLFPFQEGKLMFFPPPTGENLLYYPLIFYSK
jgi:hypothetical protein